jgi:diadenosine tetraphosphate (Ap4A) HIT family hydrolase
MTNPTPEVDCPFCYPRTDAIFLESELVIGVWDAFPVSDGHALLITRRHIGSWFEASETERHALMEAIDSARRAILHRHRPDGFNIGVNVGEAAGQTIPHLHVHVIPRYIADVPDPRGGVRHVIPRLANYLVNEASVAERDRRLVHRR